MSLREDIERSEEQFRKVLGRKMDRCEAEQVDTVLTRLTEAFKRKQRKLFAKHHWGEPVILKFPTPPDPQPPRAA